MTKHKQFIESNNLDASKMPEGIKEKIQIYTEMEQVIAKLTGNEKNLKKRSLKKLDQEIYDDLLDEFGSDLDGNDLPASKEEAMKEIADTLAEIFEEEEISKEQAPPFKKGDPVEIIGGASKFIGLTAKVHEYHPSGKNSKAPEAVTLESKKFPEGKALYELNHVKKSSAKPIEAELKGDEKILDQLYAIGRKEDLKRSVLKELGIKTHLGRGPIKIGQMTLTKTRTFSFTYRLEKEPRKSSD